MIQLSGEQILRMIIVFDGRYWIFQNQLVRFCTESKRIPSIVENTKISQMN